MTQPDKAALAREHLRELFEKAPWMANPVNENQSIGGCHPLTYGDLAILRSADGMRSALEKIYETLSSLDRPTVNQQNAFEHFSALNGTLLEIKRIAKAALAAPSVKTNSGLR